jgi:hypothetical protein
MQGFVSIGPLLFESQKPNKSEEWLDHMIRFARMSEREFFLVTRRCLFAKYYDGCRPPHAVPAYNKYGESKSKDRFMMNDETGEGYVGRMKTARAYTEPELLRRSKLFNYLEQLRGAPGRKRYRTSSRCQIEQDDYLRCVFNIFEELQLRPADRKCTMQTKRDEAVALIAVALGRRKSCRRRPILHKRDTYTQTNYRQIIANLRAEKDKTAVSGSTADWVASGFDKQKLRRPDKDGSPGAGTTVDWPLHLRDDLINLIGRSAVNKEDFTKFGALAEQIRSYVMKARTLSWPAKDLPEKLTLQFLHETPLGPGAGLDPASIAQHKYDALQ